MARPAGPRHPYACQTENVPERPPGSLFGDNPSGWAFGRMGRSRHEAREPLRRARRVAGARRAGGPVRRRRGARAPRRDRLRHARRGGGDVPPVASLPAMRRPSGPEGRIRALGGAEAEVPGVRRRARVARRAPSSRAARSRSRPGRPSSGWRRSPCRRRRPPGPHRAAGPRPGRRGLRRRRGPLRGIRAGGQARAVQAEAVHSGGHRCPQGARRGGLRARRALRRPHQGGARGPRRGRARRSSTTARGPIASPSGRTVSRTSPARRTRGARSARRRRSRRATCARGPSATSGASPAWTPRTCSPTRTPTSASSGSSATTRGGPRSQGRSAICSWPKRGSAGEGRSPITYLGGC